MAPDQTTNELQSEDDATREAQQSAALWLIYTTLQVAVEGLESEEMAEEWQRRFRLDEDKVAAYQTRLNAEDEVEGGYLKARLRGLRRAFSASRQGFWNRDSPDPNTIRHLSASPLRTEGQASGGRKYQVAALWMLSTSWPGVARILGLPGASDGGSQTNASLSDLGFRQDAVDSFRGDMEKLPAGNAILFDRLRETRATVHRHGADLWTPDPRIIKHLALGPDSRSRDGNLTIPSLDSAGVSG